MATYEVGFKPGTISSASGSLTDTRTHHSADYTAIGSTIPVVHLVALNQSVTFVTAGGRATTSGVSGSAQYAIYETDVTGLSQGALLGIVATISTSSPTVAYYSSAPLSINLSAHVGKYIKLAVGADSGWRRAQITGSSGDVVSNNATFPNPFGSASNQSIVMPMYLTIEDAANSIDSVNGDDELIAAGANTAEVTGYDDGVNPIISGTVGSLALSSVSQTGIDVAFTIDSPVNNSYYPEPDAEHTLTLTDGTTPATFDAIMRFADYTSVVVASPVNDSEYYLGIWATTPPVNGDRYIYDPLFWTVAADGSYTGATEGPSTIWLHWRASDSKIFAYQSTVSDGVIVSGGLSVTGLSVTGLSVRGLSVRGL